ncbi:MAG: hypothetical protein MR663_00655 [Lachnospiraceae bacterium]|nr:hypothetical protein [Lachnospiraceae bacterium]
MVNDENNFSGICHRSYQYNADAFEARDADEVKQEAAYKEVSKVREYKAR